MYSFGVSSKNQLTDAGAISGLRSLIAGNLSDNKITAVPDVRKLGHLQVCVCACVCAACPGECECVLVDTPINSSSLGRGALTVPRTPRAIITQAPHLHVWC